MAKNDKIGSNGRKWFKMRKKQANLFFFFIFIYFSVNLSILRLQQSHVHLLGQMYQKVKIVPKSGNFSKNYTELTESN